MIKIMKFYLKGTLLGGHLGCLLPTEIPGISVKIKATELQMVPVIASDTEHTLEANNFLEANIFLTNKLFYLY